MPSEFSCGAVRPEPPLANAVVGSNRLGWMSSYKTCIYSFTTSLIPQISIHILKLYLFSPACMEFGICPD